jgi:hypothetical protein
MIPKYNISRSWIKNAGNHSHTQLSETNHLATSTIIISYILHLISKDWFLGYDKYQTECMDCNKNKVISSNATL